ncbi:MAG: hypothetical protein AB1480_09780 [Nitrospirota bacterium]
MRDLIVSATVLDEICIAKRQEASNEYETLDYIPGRIIWGAFASMTGVQLGETPPENFANLFYSDDVVFSNLYPSDDTKTLRSVPVPISARTYKHAPGFINDPSIIDYEPGGVIDCLLDDVPVEIKENPEYYIKYDAYYVGHHRTIRQEINYIVRNERDIRRGTSREGMLFTRQNIPRGSVLLGFIRSNTDEGDKALEWLLNQTGLNKNKEIEVSIGRSPGRIRLQITSATKGSILYVFDNELEDIDDNTFTITCISPAIILDPFLRPMKYIPDEVIKKELEDILKSCSLIRHFSATEIIQGWNSAYRRPMEDEIAIARGSAFYYKYELSAGKTKNELVNALNKLKRKGIGLRRAEGFGEIRVNDPFHIELRSIQL